MVLVAPELPLIMTAVPAVRLTQRPPAAAVAVPVARLALEITVPHQDRPPPLVAGVAAAPMGEVSAAPTPRRQAASAVRAISALVAARPAQSMLLAVLARLAAPAVEVVAGRPVALSPVRVAQGWVKPSGPRPPIQPPLVLAAAAVVAAVAVVPAAPVPGVLVRTTVGVAAAAVAQLAAMMASAAMVAQAFLF